MEPIIRYILIAIISLLLGYFLNRYFSKSKIDLSSGNAIASMPKFYYFIALTGMILGLFLLFGGLEYIDDLSSAQALIPLLGIVILLSSIYLYLCARNHKVLLNDEEIIVLSTRGKEKKACWSEIQEVRFNALSSSYVIKTGTGKISIHQHMLGIKQILDIVEQRAGIKIVRYDW